MKCFCLLVLSIFSLVKADSNFEIFAQKYPYIYQDVVINGEIFPVGTDQCENRYELIKPIFEKFNRPFTVMDLGAAQGYFSFRIAKDFPQSLCVMVEANHTAYYALHGDMLHDLCQMNHQLGNIYYLQRCMDINDLEYLNQHEHFDVIIAFLVVHLMHKEFNEQVKIVQQLLSLTDNLIFEVADDVGVIHTSYVDYLADRLNAQYLGEVKRHKDASFKSRGRLYWFKNSTDRINVMPLQQATFEHLNGIYPSYK